MRADRPAVWVTRPAAQAGPLAARLQERGFDPIVAPLIAIEPAVVEAEAQGVAAALERFGWVFFVSANAARLAVPAVRRYRAWPPGPPVATVGAASAAELRALGFPEVWHPQKGAESEAVLAEAWTQPAVVAGHSVLIVKGEGGRALLADTLRQRGAEVAEWVCYRRSPGTWSEAVWQAWAAGRLAAVLVTSSEAARWLPKVAGEKRFERLRATLPAVANHPQVAEVLRQLGWQIVHTAERVGDEALVARLESIKGVRQ